MKKSVIFFYLLLCILATNAEGRYIQTSDSVQLYIHVKGSGPTCLYLHGGPGSGSYWLEKFFGDFLEQHFQMVYLDQRGVGRSSSPSDDNYSMDRMVKDFEEVREALEVDRWLTLGHSFGGLLQMGYVNQAPEHVSGMIFINCTLSMHDSFETSWLPKAIELAGDHTPAMCHDTSISIFERMLAIMPVLSEKGVMWKLFNASEEDHLKLNETYSQFQTWNSDYSEKALEIADYWADFRKSTSSVNQPVLFFYGSKDWAVGPNHYKEISFPNMTLYESNVGHMPFLENKEELAIAIENFLSSNPF